MLPHAPPTCLPACRAERGGGGFGRRTGSPYLSKHFSANWCLHGKSRVKKASFACSRGNAILMLSTYYHLNHRSVFGFPSFQSRCPPKITTAGGSWQSPLGREPHGNPPVEGQTDPLTPTELHLPPPASSSSPFPVPLPRTPPPLSASLFLLSFPFFSDVSPHPAQGREPPFYCSHCSQWGTGGRSGLPSQGQEDAPSLWLSEQEGSVFPRRPQDPAWPCYKNVVIFRDNQCSETLACQAARRHLTGTSPCPHLTQGEARVLLKASGPP